MVTIWSLGPGPQSAPPAGCCQAAMHSDTIHTDFHFAQTLEYLGETSNYHPHFYNRASLRAGFRSLIQLMVNPRHVVWSQFAVCAFQHSPDLWPPDIMLTLAH